MQGRHVLDCKMWRIGLSQKPGFHPAALLMQLLGWCVVQREFLLCLYRVIPEKSLALTWLVLLLQCLAGLSMPLHQPHAPCHASSDTLPDTV